MVDALDAQSLVVSQNMRVVGEKASAIAYRLQSRGPVIGKVDTHFVDLAMAIARVEEITSHLVCSFGG